MNGTCLVARSVAMRVDRRAAAAATCQFWGCQHTTVHARCQQCVLDGVRKTHDERARVALRRELAANKRPRAGFLARRWAQDLLPLCLHRLTGLLAHISRELEIPQGQLLIQESFPQTLPRHNPNTLMQALPACLHTACAGAQAPKVHDWNSRWTAIVED
jgi:hypothetical protein